MYISLLFRKTVPKIQPKMVSDKDVYCFSFQHRIKLILCSTHLTFFLNINVCTQNAFQRPEKIINKLFGNKLTLMTAKGDISKIAQELNN